MSVTDCWSGLGELHLSHAIYNRIRSLGFNESPFVLVGQKSLSLCALLSSDVRRTKSHSEHSLSLCSLLRSKTRGLVRVLKTYQGARRRFRLTGRSPCNVNHVWSWCLWAPATSCKAYGSVMVTSSLKFLLRTLPRDSSLECLCQLM